MILLIDGVNDDGDQSDDEQQLDDLLDQLRSGGRASDASGACLHDRTADAAASDLRRIAEASTAVAYESTDPTSIDQVLTAVVSNF